MKKDPILLIEDDPDIQENLRQFFEYEGIAVSSVYDGKEALDYLRSGKPARMIFLDLMMPVMNGWEFRKRQKMDAKIAGIPVVLISAGGNVDDQAYGVDAAARRFFNSAVGEFNAAVQSIPAVFFAKNFGFTQRTFFDVGETARAQLDQAPQIKF